MKSTINEFKKTAVKHWAEKLQSARKSEKCRLVLVGNYQTNLEGVHKVGMVDIEKRNLDIPGLFDQAAHRVAKFIHTQKLKAGTPSEYEIIVHALITILLRHSVTRTRLSHEEFVSLLVVWIKGAPRHKRIVDISHMRDKHVAAEFIGREAETKLLNDAWDKAVRGEAHPHVLTFVALGGEGKTSLVAKWAAELAHRDWPGCDAVFAWSFYSQGKREQVAASSDLFLSEALKFFGDAAMAGSNQSADDKGRRLAQLLGEQRALLILDGVEPLQYAPTAPKPGELKDRGLSALLKGLAAISCGLCVVTTRYSIPDLNAFRQNTAPEYKLERLSTPAGKKLLQILGVSGAEHEFEALVEDVKGHALTLNLLGTWLRNAYGGDIRRRDQVKPEEADAEEQGGHAFRVMDAYVLWFESEGERGKRAIAIVRLLGLFDRPVTADCFAALLNAPVIQDLTELLVGISKVRRNQALQQLEDTRLLTVNRNPAHTLVALDAHPLLREYFARQLRIERPGAWRASHQRLYEHLYRTTPNKPEPTLEDLQPLYQAVVHGCQAGRQQEVCEKVYRDRILRGAGKGGFYTTKKIGAFGSDLAAVACFFEQPWSRISPARLGSTDGVHRAIRGRIGYER